MLYAERAAGSTMYAVVAWGLLTAAVAAAAASGRQFRLTVLHTNDLHSHYDETCPEVGGGGGGGRCSGGFARLRGALDRERARADADGAPAVHLFAGDLFQGTPFYDALGWRPAADFIGDLGVDAMCLGNHEFEDGPEGLAPFLSSKNLSSIPIVVANINTENEPSITNIHPSIVLTVGNHTVGIVGYLTPNTMWLNNVGKIKITDELQSVKTEVAKLKKSGVNFIIGLGHSGLIMDEQIAKEVDGIDAIIGGHSHTYLCNGTPQDTEIPVGPYPVIIKRNKQIVPVVQASENAKYLGKLVLTFNSENCLINAVGGPIFLDQTIPQDEKMLKKVQYYKKLMAEIMIKKVIGKTIVLLDGNCKCKETNLADLIVDSFIHFNLNNLLKNKINVTGWTDAAVAITISSSIKSSIDAINTKGEIYYDDVDRVLPYKTQLFKVTLNGTTLLKALEHSASLFDYKNCASPENNIYGGFMQMSGMYVTYNIKKSVGSRVQSVMIRCSECNLPLYEPIILNKEYVIIMPKYIMNGGDQYTMIKEGIINIHNLNVTENEALKMYFKEKSPIYAGVDNRIKIIS